MNSELLKKARLLFYKKEYINLKKEVKEALNAKLIELINTPVNSNTIAIIEDFDSHAENLPSYIKYFLELGYDIHLIAQEKILKEKPFVYCNFPEDKVKIFKFPAMFFNQDFFDNLLRYKFIFLATYLYEKYATYGLVYKSFYIDKHNKNNLYVVNHEIDENLRKLEGDVYKDRTFVLKDGIKIDENSNYPFISPVYFGEFKNLIRNKSTDKIKFLSVGGNWNVNLRNYDSLFESIYKLINEGIKNFEVIFIGNMEKEFKNRVTDLISPYIKITGRINFDELYKYYLESDFLLYNIDKTTSGYQRYIKMGISGAYPATIGFLIPSIIEENVADSYGFGDDCVVRYEYSNVYNAMKEAIELSSDEYIAMQNRLHTIKKNLEKQSIDNLKRIFKGYDYE